ncbi:hypothetical protein FIBSPDRAFT_930113 [Athelia psychrophila]|uniref:Uncharacterized protein n=1 Tax=Athelia psychrophila TaxID=1759441 RepID=A0A166MNP2_9AGAM|nr:hypothetical protein FIBSPDRAFT_930113 [Fibularhizoctonia sp. CBS 109695]
MPVAIRNPAVTFGLRTTSHGLDWPIGARASRDALQQTDLAWLIRREHIAGRLHGGGVHDGQELSSPPRLPDICCQSTGHDSKLDTLERALVTDPQQPSELEDAWNGSRRDLRFDGVVEAAGKENSKPS